MVRTTVGRRLGRLALVAAVLVPTLCASAPKEPVSAKLAAFTVTTGVDGVEVKAPADLVSPGDVIEYELTYTNESAVDASALTATLPLPTEVAYAASTATPGEVTVSLDGATFHALPLLREQVRADGTTELVEVPTRCPRASIGRCAGPLAIWPRATA